MSPERFTVRSQDGIDISVQKAGAGPGLLLIHGAMLNGSLSWGAVIPKFAERFTVYAMDRRGRAPSGDARAYSIANESDDIVRVVEAIGGPVIILAHSYGALASLDAIDRLKMVSHLMLYEPPVTAEGARPDYATVLAHLDSALAADDREKILMTFLTEQVRMPADSAAKMKSSPIWSTLLQIAPTLPRESRVVNTYRISTDRLANCRIPTTVLLGSVTVGIMHDAAFFLRDTIPGCRLDILDGQGHGAMLDAPQFFASKILEIAK
jgi:pimeloyl-ACP methyl ester carboxylesterase